MIDLHCHILPGIDDGALDLDDSVAMARVAAADGVELICATPHIRHDHDVRIGELPGRVGDLNDELRARSVQVRVRTGGELAETAIDGLSEDELRTVSLGGGGAWLLVEPAPGPLGESLQRAVAELARRGYGSVIAHPERHLGAGAEERLAGLVRGGALVQATAEALLEARTAHGMLHLAARGLIHVLGSDSHSSRHGRPARLSRALATLAAAEPIAMHADWIAVTAPGAIVRGEPLRPPYEPAV